MRGPNPSAVVVALSTVVAVSTVGFMVSVLGNAGGASATLPIPGITGSAAPLADEVPGPPPIEVGPGASDDAPVAGDTPADPQTPESTANGTPNGSAGGGSAQSPTSDSDGTDVVDTPLVEPEPTPVQPPPATPVTPPKPTQPPSTGGKPEHANPGNGNGNGNAGNSGNGTNGQSNKP